LEKRRREEKARKEGKRGEERADRIQNFKGACGASLNLVVGNDRTSGEKEHRETKGVWKPGG